MIAKVCGLGVGKLVIVLGSAHVYLNHIEQIEEQLTRKPYSLPVLELDSDINNIDDYKYENIRLVNYKCHPAIKGEISI